MNYYTYHFIVNGRVVHTGITTDPTRQQLADQARWSQGHIQVVGGPMPERAAMAWKANADRQARLAGKSPQGPRYAGDEAIGIDIERDDGIVTVSVTGRMDSVSAQSFHRETRPLIEDAARGVVLNLTDLTFMSSGGLRATLLLARQLGARRSTLVMYGLSEMVREVYAISGFDRFLNIVESRAAAMAIVGREESSPDPGGEAPKPRGTAR